MKYYIINNELFDNTEFAYSERFGKINSGEAIRCNECGSFLSMLKWLPPYQLKVSKKNLGDFIFGTQNGFVLSEKAKTLFEQSGQKGLNNFKKVELYYKMVKLESNYYYPEITLSDVRINIKKSGLRFDSQKECDCCQKAGRIIKDMKGVFFENENQINEDVFFTKMLSGTITVSENFISFVNKYKLTNLKFIEVEKYIPVWL